MATRIKMLTLLQETHGHAHFINRRPPARPAGAMLWQIPSAPARRARILRRKTLTVIMQDPPNIPDPVSIRHLQAAATSVSPTAPA
ncbi:MAG TPA: hypothetical protein VJA21_02510 [Verrucomicrobiae bacterium]